MMIVVTPMAPITRAIMPPPIEEKHPPPPPPEDSLDELVDEEEGVSEEISLLEEVLGADSDVVSSEEGSLGTLVLSEVVSELVSSVEEGRVVSDEVPLLSSLVMGSLEDGVELLSLEEVSLEEGISLLEEGSSPLPSLNR